MRMTYFHIVFCHLQLACLPRLMHRPNIYIQLMLCLLGESQEPEQVQVQPLALHPQLLRPKARLTLRPGSCRAHSHKLAAQGALSLALARAGQSAPQTVA